MKRFLPVVLGAFAGAIGLPLVMFACARLAHIGFSGSVNPLSMTLPELFFKARLSEIIGGVLGAWSAILYCGQRTFWLRMGSAICALSAGGYVVWLINQHYPLSNPALIFSPLWRPVLFRQLCLSLPLILWAVGLFFFAILARKRTDSKSLLP